MSSFTTAQSASRADNIWKWSVWIEGSDTDLDRIDAVTYVLHHTFPDPVQVRVNRADRFRIDEWGWGEFWLKVEIKLRDGSRTNLRHNLLLDGPARPPRKEPLIFISHAVADLPEFRLLSDALNSRGVQVVSAQDVDPGEPWPETVERNIELSDMVLALVSGPLSGTVSREVMTARQRDIPVHVVALDGALDVPSLLGESQAFRVHRSDVAGIAEVASQVASALKPR